MSTTGKENKEKIIIDKSSPYSCRNSQMSLSIYSAKLYPRREIRDPHPSKDAKPP